MIDFRILGPLEVAGEKGLIPLAGQRQRALLGLLLLRANEVVPTERLVDLLYGEEPPPTATTSLHNTVSQLRKLLGPEVLVTRPPGYVLRVAPEQLDLARFERLVRSARSADPLERAGQLRDALSLWRGTPLADLQSAEFAQAEIRRLEELRLAALEDRLDADLELSRHADLVAELESLVSQHPLRERLRRQLMLALYRSGRQAEALQAYQDARRTLLDELGIDPSPELQQLHGAILRQDRTLVPAAPTEAGEDQLLEVTKALLAGRLVLVLGPGVALSGRPDPASWAQTEFPPVLEELASHLADSFEWSRGEPELARVSQYIAVTRGVGRLYDELHELFDCDYAPGPVHRFLAWLPGFLRERGAPYPLVVTTSLDDTIERTLRDADEPFDLVCYIATGRDRGRFLHIAPDGSTRVVQQPNADTELSPDRRPVVLKLHGRVDRSPARASESFAVSEDDHIDYLAGAEIASFVPVSLAAKLRRSHFLFLGYGPDVWSLRVFLRRVWGDERVGYRSWAVHPEPDPLVRLFWSSRDVDTYDVPLERYVEDLRVRLEQLAPEPL